MKRAEGECDDDHGLKSLVPSKRALQEKIEHSTTSFPIYEQGRRKIAQYEHQQSLQSSHKSKTLKRVLKISSVLAMETNWEMFISRIAVVKVRNGGDVIMETVIESEEEEE